MKIILTVKSGPHEGQRFVINEPGTYSIGRSSDVDWNLPEDNRISRKHCLIEVKSDKTVWLVDLESTQGTFINSRIQRRPSQLVSNDTILIGFTSITISLDGLSQNKEGYSESFPNFTLVKRLPSSDTRNVYWALPNGHYTFVILHFISISNQIDSREAKTIDKLLLTASIASRIGNHPGILPFRGQGRTGQVMWFATGFVDAIPMNIFRQSQGNLSLANVVDIGKQVIDVVSHLHRNGVIHRSISPDSFWVMTNQAESKYQVYLTDIASAKWQQVEQLQPYTTTGQVGYRLTQFSAPETFIDYKKLDPRSDIYAVGAVLYFLLSGQLPHGSLEGEDAFKIIFETPHTPLVTLCPEISPGIIEIVEKAMAREMNNRYESIQEMSIAWRQIESIGGYLSSKKIDLVALQKNIGTYFNLGEIQLLCFQLNIEYENIEGSTRTEKSMMLIQYCKRHGLLHELVTLCQRNRPHLDW